MTWLLTLGFFALMTYAFVVFKKKFQALQDGGIAINSLPEQYGHLAVLLSLSPLVSLLLLGALLKIAAISVTWWVLMAIALACGVGVLGVLKKHLHHNTKARDALERVIGYVFLISATISIATTFAILFSILIEAFRFFESQSVWYFLTGTQWSPGAAFLEGAGRETQGDGAKFGSIPLFSGTLMITGIAMLVAVPFGVLSAVYVGEYASPKMRSILKPLIEILAGIPTIVYGFFAAVTVAPLFVSFFETLGFEVSFNNALASGVIMGVMITPIVMSLSEDAIRSVPDTLRQAALGLGILRTEMIKTVVLPVAMPGIIAAIILGISRAVGETMIVVMAAGLRPNITLNPLEDMTTITVKIVEALTGDHAFDSAQTLSVFALGLVLFVFTIVLNGLSLYVIRHFNAKYRNHA